MNSTYYSMDMTLYFRLVGITTDPTFSKSMHDPSLHEFIMLASDQRLAYWAAHHLRAWLCKALRLDV